MEMRELAERRSSGLVVRLLWDPCRDTRPCSGTATFAPATRFVTDVPNARALSAFRHPNAFRPSRAA